MIFYLSYLEIDIMDVSLESKSSIYSLLSYPPRYIRKSYTEYVLTIGYVYVSLTEIPPKINPINLYDITFLFIALFVLIFHEFQNNAFCQLLSQIINIVLWKSVGILVHLFSSRESVFVSLEKKMKDPL